MKSGVFSRGTTLQLPNTQRMLYPPQHNPVLQCVCVCLRECLSPNHHGILQETSCARWLISTEDTLLLLFFLSSLCFSTLLLLTSHEYILFTILSLRWCPRLPLTLLPWPTVHYTSSSSSITQGSTLQKCTLETLRRGRGYYLEIKGSGSLCEWLSIESIYTFL